MRQVQTLIENEHASVTSSQFGENEIKQKLSCSVKTLNIIRIPLISLATLKLQLSFKLIYIYMYYIMF